MLRYLRLWGTKRTPSSEALPKISEPVEMQAFFSPRGGCTEAIVAAIRAAQRSIVVQAYGFDNLAIADALVEAHKRSIVVQVLLDKINASVHYSLAGLLTEAGIPLFIDAAHAIAHNKIMVIDGETVITGSFNFTRPAELYNAENVLIVKNRRLAEQYMANWLKHRAHSTPLPPNTPAALAA